MYSCAGCGADLKFNIKLQKLRCDHCGNTYAVGELSDNKAYNKDEFEANVFTCSQCGGTIYTQENDLTGLCTYCGSHTTFQSRTDKVERPRWIIPFQIEKEECKTRYRQMISRAFFCPSEMKDPKYIDGIRGVYMPYWIYNYNFDKEVNINASKKKLESHGDYFMLYPSLLHFKLRAYYLALRRDASIGFSDELSEELKPFSLEKLETFSPAYLCGFFGETADTTHQTAQSNEEEVKEGKKKLKDFVQGKFPEYGLEVGSMYDKVRKEKNELGLMPVWFLSYRNGKRVSYSAINGKTGEMVAEIPISLKKFAACTAILSALLFLLLNLFLVMKPEYVSMLAACLAALALHFCAIDLNMLVRKESGFAYNPRSDGEKAIITTIIGGILLGGLITLDSFGKLSSLSFLCTRFIPIVVCFAVLIRGIIDVAAIRKDISYTNKTYPGYLAAFAAIIISTLVEIIHPVSDMAYFGVGFVCMALVILSLLCVIHYHNLMSSRKLPQFDHMGGDGSAKG